VRARCRSCWSETNSRYETSDKGRARKDAWLDVFENRVKAQFSKGRYRWRAARQRRHGRFADEFGAPARSSAENPFWRLSPRLLGGLRVELPESKVTSNVDADQGTVLRCERQANAPAARERPGAGTGGISSHASSA
jgi:hypothetical protein